MAVFRSLALTFLTILMAVLAVNAVGATVSVHIIQPGETLAVIAQQYGVSVEQLAALNNLEDAHTIYSWQLLNIPAGGRPGIPRAASNFSPPRAAGTYTVQRGDTMFSIASRFGLTAEELMSANGITDPHLIHSGLTLNLNIREAPEPPAASEPATAASEPATAASAPAQTVPAQAPASHITASAAAQARFAGGLQEYIVRRGEYLTELGVRFDLEWMILAEHNNISPPYVLHTGQALRIPSFAQYLGYLPNHSNYKLFYTTNHHPGPRIGVGREIVIELNRQSIYAYENGVLQKRALMSSGKMLTPTVLGDYEIYLKFRSQTMSGPGYSLDNVEWPMYFIRGYAIHGTWWHTMFGTPMSHGCVNLTNEDAKWFWEFAPLGTPVHVRN